MIWYNRAGFCWSLVTNDNCTHVQVSHVTPVRRNIPEIYGDFTPVSMASGDELPAKDQKEQSKEEVR